MEQSSSPVNPDPGLEVQIHGLILEALNYDDLGMPLVRYAKGSTGDIDYFLRRLTKSIVKV